MPKLGSTIRPMMDRFFSKVHMVPEAGCWIWAGCISGETRYGAFMLSRGKQMGAHRASWIIHRGPIPEGMFVCHKCDTRECVNPDHLFLGTHTDNMQDCSRKGRTSRPYGRLSGKAKAVIRICPVTGDEKRYGAASEAEWEGFHAGNVIKICRGNGRTHAGYKWRYAD